MTKKLLIVESPAKAKTISKYLDGEYVVSASVGHIRDLPKSNKNAIDIEGGFIPHYEVVKGKEKIISDLKKQAGRSEEVVLATDPDREGEAIAWHLAEALGIKPKKIKRVRFYEITKEAVQEAMEHPTTIDNDLRRAQEARRVLDRLVGYDLSGLIWKKLRYGLSAGRVQSPALRILMEREREIRAFKPEDYWVITADVTNAEKTPFLLTCTEEPDKEEVAERILKVGRNGSWSISDLKETEAKRSPRAPFTTSTLQQTASTRLGFAPARTMGVAQKLYEGGHITYMRTDSTTLSKQAQAQIASFVKSEYGGEYLQVRNYKTKSRGAQEAHEAIRPTSVGKQHSGATDDQKNLYRLIWERAVASQMSDARLKKSKLIAHITPSDKEKEVPDFYANGSRVVFDGWLRADTRARGEDVEIPRANVGESLALIDMHSEGKQTQPLPRYSEAGLIKELEKRGIGRPSTYASIIKTLSDREYVTKEGRTLFPTDTGEVVSDFLEKHFEKYISDDFTAEMENELDEIAEGKREYKQTLTDFYKPFIKEVKSKEKLEKITNLGDAPKEFKCPKCNAPMIIKLGRGGKFMSCSRFPECDGARTIDGKEVAPEEPIGKDPKTGEPVYVLHGRFGPYIQIGEKTKENPKPKRASVPKEKNPDEVTLKEALIYLSLPRELGKHPKTGETITANVGRFGPYIVHESDFRSLKKDDVYTIELPRALEILAEEKKTRGGKKKGA